MLRVIKKKIERNFQHTVNIRSFVHLEMLTFKSKHGTSTFFSHLFLFEQARTRIVKEMFTFLGINLLFLLLLHSAEFLFRCTLDNFFFLFSSIKNSFWFLFRGFFYFLPGIILKEGEREISSKEYFVQTFFLFKNKIFY